LLASLLLFAGVFSIYFAFRTNAHTWEALSVAAELKYGGNYYLFYNPVHIGYAPLAYLFLAIWRGLGSDDVMLSLQVLDMLFGALGVTLFFHLLRRVLGSNFILVGALLLAFSTAYWYYSTDIEAYILPTPLLILAFWLLIKPERSDAALSWIGVLIGFATLLHSPHGFFAILVVLAQVGQRVWLKNSLRFLVPMALIVGAGYLLAILAMGLRNERELACWFFQNSRTTRWGFVTWWNFPRSLGGMYFATTSILSVIENVDMPGLRTAVLGGQALL